MAENVNIAEVTLCLDKLWGMTCKQLKEILKENGQNISGNKQILVARCYALNSVIDERTDEVPSEDNNGKTTDANQLTNPLSPLETLKKIGFNELNFTAKGRQWETDLRLFPPCNFHQLFQYLVVRTNKYGESEMKGVCYKKMKSYQFFQEGHIKSYEIARGFKKIWVKAKVIASMKHEMYRVIGIFEEDGDVLFAACDCPAGLGINGAGKCNHVGGLLFAITDFHEKGLHRNREKVSCTSKLNGWIVPRNLTVQPKPVADIKIKKVLFGKQRKDTKTVNTFDPRAPQDKTVNPFSLNRLYESLKEHAPNSAFFLYHDHDPPIYSDPDVEPDFVDNLLGVNVAVNTSVTTTYSFDLASSNEAGSDNINQSVQEKLSLPIPLININTEIKDVLPIDDTFCEKYVIPVIESEMLSDDQISDVEKSTRDQSQSDFWQKLHVYKATASNFGKIIKCSKNPDGLLKAMFYDKPTSKTLSYGKENEHLAIKAYLNKKDIEGCAVNFESVGIILCKDRPGFGASLDGLLSDPSSDIKNGGLECKCPCSKAGMTIDEACVDSNFYLKRTDDGSIVLKENHNYYYQIQGQMFVTGLKWVDFVVWFGQDLDVFIQRIYFDESKWLCDCLPYLDLFYKWVVVPELLTRRVQRKLQLIGQLQWKALKSSVK